MRVVSTFHPPSAVTASVKCRLIADSDVEHLVVGKTDRLEVFSLKPSGLNKECELTTWGRVVAIRAVAIKGSDCSNVAVLTDHPEPKLFILALAVASAEEDDEFKLVTKSFIPLWERSIRESEHFNDVIVHPSGKVAVISCYTGKLKVIELKNGERTNDFDVHIPELTIFSICFLPLTSPNAITLAILHLSYQNGQHRLHLLSRDLLLSDAELSPTPSDNLLPTSLSTKSHPPDALLPLSLVPVPPYDEEEDMEEEEGEEEEKFIGGTLVLGGKKILLYDLASQDIQERHKGKRRRLDAKKGAGLRERLEAAKKERAREGKKRKPRACVEWPYGEVTAWCPLDEHNTRILLGDAFGRLALLTMELPRRRNLILFPLGQTSPPSTLTYLTAQYTYIGSKLGDTQLIRIHSTPVSNEDESAMSVPETIQSVPAKSVLGGSGKEKAREKGEGTVVKPGGCYLEEIERWQNIAPVADAVLVDVERGGQPQIVTCSGDNNAGALKVIRNGADFHEIAVAEGLENVSGVWPLKEHYRDSVHSHLLLTTPHNSYLFRLDKGDVLIRVDTASAGLSDRPTLTAANVSRRVVNKGSSSYEDSSWVVQVTKEKAILVEYDSNLEAWVSTGQAWAAGDLAGQGGLQREIVAASVNGSQIVLGLSGGLIVLLNLDQEGRFKLVQQKAMSGDGIEAPEISAISCIPLNAAKPYTANVLVSFWGSNRVDVLSLASAEHYLEPVCTTGHLPALARSLLLYNFGTGQKLSDPDFKPHLLVGLADGTLLSYAFKKNELSEKKVISLGNGPVSLTWCEAGGKRTVVAGARRACVLFWDKERLHQSPVLVKDTAAVSAVNAASYPSSLIFAGVSSLVMGEIRHLDKMHIRSIPFGIDVPRRIVHNPDIHAFGVAYIRSEPVCIDEPEVWRSSFRLLDDTTFQSLHEFPLDEREEISAVNIIHIEVPEHPTPYFCIGTMVHKDDGQEPTEGHLLVLSAHADQGSSSHTALSLIATQSVPGCVYDIVMVEGVIIAAVNSIVIGFRLRRGDHGSVLEKFSEWNHNYVVSHLVPSEDKVLVGDPLGSLSVLKVTSDKFEIVARDYSPLWPVAIQSLDSRSVIAADSDCNLSTFSLQHKGYKSTLELDGNYYIGELVNKFIPGAITSSDAVDDPSIQPKQVFFTSSGRIGVIIEMNDETSLHMTALQQNMANVISGAGGENHTEWRAPSNARGRTDAQPTSFGFLDGDYLEQLLALSSSSPQTKAIIAGSNEAERLKSSYGQVQQVLERLHSLH